MQRKKQKQPKTNQKTNSEKKVLHGKYVTLERLERKYRCRMQKFGNSSAYLEVKVPDKLRKLTALQFEELDVLNQIVGISKEYSYNTLENLLELLLSMKERRDYVKMHLQILKK